MKLRLFVFIALLFVVGVLAAQNNVNAVSFDGVDDHVQIASSLGIGTTYTVEGWFYPTNLGGTGDIATYGRTIFSSSATSNVYPLWVTVYGSQIWLRTWTTATTDRIINAGLTTNQWYHLAITSTKGGITTTYLNGIPVDSYTNAGTASVNWPTSFTIGAIRPVRPTSILAFQGLIDEVRVWNNIRTGSEILANMSIPISPIPTNLVGYWKFDEPYPTTTAFDSAGTQQNGTLANGAFFAPSDLTLPVELSSFTAVLLIDNMVKITWITQSETDLQGYYIFRSNNPSLDDATCINTMIYATNSTNQSTYTFVDEEAEPGNTWYYWLQSVNLDGTYLFHGPVSVYISDGDSQEIPGIPVSTVLFPVYPNPFNPIAYISYGVSARTEVKLHIFNTRGQLVRDYIEGYREIGNYRVTWDGKDNNGRNLPTGIYFIRLLAGTESFIQKAVLAK